MLGLQLYSDKCLLNMKGRQSHPIRMSILNLEHYTRSQNIIDVGFFPIMERAAEMTFTQWRQVKLCMHHKCLNKLLEQVKRISDSDVGLSLKDPSGRPMTVVPRLMSYITDDPEAKDCSLVRGGNSMFPCELLMTAPRGSMRAQTPCTDHAWLRLCHSQQRHSVSRRPKSMASTSSRVDCMALQKARNGRDVAHRCLESRPCTSWISVWVCT